MGDPDSYRRFYEELGERYPETSLVHADRGKGSRFWTVSRELRAFAKRGLKMLDIGCNDGVYTIPYCANGGKAFGVDISTALVKKAREQAVQFGIKCSFEEVDIESVGAVKQIGEQFDLVLLSEVLEHVRNPDAVMTNVRDLTRPGGHLLLTSPTPILEDIIPFNLRYIRDVVKGERLLEGHVIDTRNVKAFQQYGVSGYLYRHDAYYPKALRRYVEGFGFETKRFYTVGIPIPIMALRMSMAHRGPSFPRNPAEDSRQFIGPSKLPLPGRLWAAAKYSNRYFEPLLRHLPVVKYLGANCVGIFRKCL